MKMIMLIQHAEKKENPPLCIWWVNGVLAMLFCNILLLIIDLVAQLSFFWRLDRWLFQCRSFCKITPKYLTCLYNFIFCPLIWKFKHLVIFLFLGLKKMIILVLIMFSESLFARIHSFASFKSLLICLLSFLRINQREGDLHHLQNGAQW